MPVNLELRPGLPVAGVRLASLAAGVKPDGRDDLVLITLPAGTTASAVFTRNTFAAAPVQVCREHMARNKGAVRALLINSGNANAGTGEPGRLMALGHCGALSQALNVPTTSVLPFSTGVIGQLLPDAVMLAGIQNAAAIRSAPVGSAAVEVRRAAPVAEWHAAARAIMTTDTVPKLTSRQITLADGQQVTVTGMAKGAGMIQPDMATMLAYVFTDATVDVEPLQQLLREAMAVSFNAITVDSDTSTNDACVLCATGIGASVAPDGSGSPEVGTGAQSRSTGVPPGKQGAETDWNVFRAAVTDVCRDLAHAIVRDAEGATKFITVSVHSGRDRAECRTVAYAIANSPLVKTACFASDANVGRLLMAIGKAGVAGLDPEAVCVSIGDVRAFEAGGIAAGYTEERGAAVMAAEEITFRIDLGRGDASAEIYTSDLSHDYVSINADYRS